MIAEETATGPFCARVRVYRGMPIERAREQVRHMIARKLAELREGQHWTICMTFDEHLEPGYLGEPETVITGNLEIREVEYINTVLYRPPTVDQLSYAKLCKSATRELWDRTKRALAFWRRR